MPITVERLKMAFFQGHVERELFSHRDILSEFLNRRQGGHLSVENKLSVYVLEKMRNVRLNQSYQR